MALHDKAVVIGKRKERSPVWNALTTRQDAGRNRLEASAPQKGLSRAKIHRIHFGVSLHAHVSCRLTSDSSPLDQKQMLPWTKEVSWQYGETYRALAAKGRLIGTNDLWIAATALAHGTGVVTDNKDEFDRVPGSVVVAY